MVASKGEKKILLIDDDAQIAKLTKKIVENAGYAFTTVETVDEARVKIPLESPHLIILDLNKPAKQDLIFLKEVCSSNSSVPVIVYSAESEVNTIQAAMSLGAVDYLTKPLKANLLLRKLKKVFLHHKKELRIEFPKEARKRIEIHSTGRLRALNEIRLLLEASMKFEKEISILMKSKVLHELNLHTKSLRTLANTAQSIGGGIFSSQLKILGVTESEAKNIRKAGLKWRR